MPFQCGPVLHTAASIYILQELCYLHIDLSNEKGYSERLSVSLFIRINVLHIQIFAMVQKQKQKKKNTKLFREQEKFKFLSTDT